MASERNQQIDPLGALFADQRIGPAAKLAFVVLWQYSGAAPGWICITAAWLGQRLGASPRAAWDWLSALQRNDLVRVGERTRRGSIEIFVWQPTPGNREAIPDSQQRLSWGHPSEAAGVEEDPVDEWPTPPPAAVESGEALGGLRAQTPECANPRGGFRAQTPEQKSANSSGKPAHAGGASGVCARKPPSPSMNSKKRRSISSQSPNVTKEFNGGSGVSAAVPERTERPETAETAPRATPLSIGPIVDAAAAALMRPIDKAGAKERLMRRLESAVGMPVAEWVLGMAANLVVYQDVPMRDLEHVLVDMEAKRPRLTSAAAWFHAQARKLAERYGKPWPRGNRDPSVAGEKT